MPNKIEDLYFLHNHFVTYLYLKVGPFGYPSELKPVLHFTDIRNIFATKK